MRSKILVFFEISISLASSFTVDTLLERQTTLPMVIYCMYVHSNKIRLIAPMTWTLVCQYIGHSRVPHGCKLHNFSIVVASSAVRVP